MSSLCGCRWAARRQAQRGAVIAYPDRTEPVCTRHVPQSLPRGLLVMGTGVEHAEVTMVAIDAGSAADATPAAHRAPHNSVAGWGTSLLGCCREPVHSALCLLCSCGCGSAYTFAKTRNMLDTSHRTCTEGCVFCLACCAGVSCMMGYTNRVQLRAKFGIPGNECQDCAVHFCCCQSCAVKLIVPVTLAREHLGCAQPSSAQHPYVCTCCTAKTLLSTCKTLDLTSHLCVFVCVCAANTGVSLCQRPRSTCGGTRL